MPRNLEVLTDKELFLKTKRIAEFVRNAKIDLWYGSSENWCRYLGISRDKKLFHVCIAEPIVKHIQKYTALQHELAHIVYRTPFSASYRLIKNWDNYEIYFNIYNILEDERIESHLTRDYIAYKKRFERTLKALGKDMKRRKFKRLNPVEVLLAVRFYRDDLAEQSKDYKEYKNAIENVRYSDKYGSLRILLTIKHLIDKYLEDEKNKFKELQEELKQIPNAGRGMLYSKMKDMDESKKQEREKCKENEYRINKSLDNDVRDEIAEMNSELSDELEKARLGQQLSPIEMKKVVSDGKYKGEKEYQEVQAKLMSGDEEDGSRFDKITYVDRPKSDYKINLKLSKGFTKLFKTLKMSQRNFVDYEGFDVNVNEYVENFIKGVNLNRSFNNKKLTNGVSIVVAIDGSSSMDQNRYNPISKIDKVRDLIGTLYHSLKTIPNVEIQGNIWSSNGKGDIAITKIENENDVSKINVERKYPMTPTHMALDYSCNMLKEMRGKKKLLLILTDGMPNYRIGRHKISMRNYKTMCRKSLSRALKITPNIVFIVIGQKHVTLMEHFFGKKRVISVPTMDSAIEKVISNFRKVIMSIFE